MPNFSRPVTYLCLALLVGGIGTAEAQQTAPSTPPVTAPAAKPKAAAPTYRVAAQDAIQVQELAPAAAGTKTPGAAGLREALWDKMDYPSWEVLLNEMPSSIPSAALRNLAADALLSSAPIPSGDISPAAQNDARATALVPFTTADDFDAFVATVPAAERTALHGRLQRDLNFAENGAGACESLPKESATVNDMLWQLYCTLANTADANRLAAAQLQLDLLRERGTQVEDEIAVADALIAHESDPQVPLALPRTMDVFNIRLLGLAKDQSLNISTSNPSVLRTRQFIIMERGGIEGADAAEWLATRGLTDADTLQAAYEAVAFTPDEMRNPNLANAMRGARQRAFIWQHLADATGDDRPRYLNDFINAGGIDVTTGVRGQLVLPYLYEITANAENAWAAPNIFALAASQHQMTFANNWYDTVITVSDTLPDAQKWLTRLWPLALALQLDRADIQRLPTWIGIAQTQPGIERIPVADILTILEAAGFPIPAETWATVTDTPTSVSAGQVDVKQLDALRAAAAANNQGEVILRAIAMLQGDISDTPPPVIAATVRALADVELPDAARRLTVEALLNLLYPGK